MFFTSSRKSNRKLVRPVPRRWHYTVQVRLPEIIKSGAILPATAGVDYSERPAVWTSTNPVWEETANKLCVGEGGLVQMGAKQSTAERFGLARIEVRPEAAPYDWVAFRAMSGISPQTAAGLAFAGVVAGADPYAWFVSFEPIEANDWLDIEVWRDERWVRFVQRTIG